MSHRLAASTLSASLLAPGAAALADPATYFAPGITFVRTTADAPMGGWSMGFEGTVNRIDAQRFDVGPSFGGLLQLEYDFDGHVRLNLGGQVFSGAVPLGGELAWSMVIGGDGVQHQAMVAPFLGVGFVNLSWRHYAGAGGYSMAGAASLKVHTAIVDDLTRGIAVEGRPLRDATGVAHKPAVRVLGRRPPPASAADLPPASRIPLGQAWLEAARDEHAAVDAFTRLAGQLVAHGAPRSLVRRALRSARDEQRHAHDCLNIAEALLGLRLALVSAPLPEGPLPSLSRLARESRLDGVVAEGAAAGMAAIGARHATVAPVQRLQARITREEAGHAELARAIERWAVQAGGAPVRAALDAAQPADADAVDIGPVAPHGDEALWRRWGRTSTAERRDAWAAVA